ncbi:hypothetical protein E4U43_004311 [Claviceps pusilla]|uniref:Transmembrane protein n=1 Tax=Claviceps pusilla TaxID=123648 RepID=A0A9P7SX46_9HYPO|nr:hypothetical protein E4U43_004311 [Claviceps pusilla]
MLNTDFLFHLGRHINDLVAAALAWLSQEGELQNQSDRQVSFADHRTSKEVLAVILAWAVTFTAVCTLILCLGFGPVGIGAGTLAAAFQSYMYGGFTPAGGIFATLTSIGMLGMLMPAAALLAAIIATGVAVAVWAWGVGR